MSRLSATPVALKASIVRPLWRKRLTIAQVLHKATAEGRLDIHELDERLVAVYAAKTYGELAPITADLVLSGIAQPAAVPQYQPAVSDRIGGQPGSAVSVAFWSGVNRKGQWTVPRMHNAVAVMGGIEIDLTARASGPRREPCTT